MSINKIKQLIISSSKSISLLDSVPSHLLPDCIDSIAPIITALLIYCSVPQRFKSAFVKPLLKNPIQIKTI